MERPAGDPQYSLMSAGQNVYVTCVIVANLTILSLTHNWTYWGELLMFMQIFSFYPIMATFAEVPIFEPIYKIMIEFLSSAPAWFGLFLAVSSIMLAKMIVNQTTDMYL